MKTNLIHRTAGAMIACAVLFTSGICHGTAAEILFETSPVDAKSVSRVYSSSYRSGSGTTTSESFEVNDEVYASYYSYYSSGSGGSYWNRYSWSNSGTTVVRAVLEFELSAIPEEFDNASIGLEIETTGAGPTINVKAFSGDGTVTTDDYELSNFTVMDSVTTQSQATQSVSIDVTQVVKDLRAEGQNILGLQLSHGVYYTQTYFSASLLTLSNVPEPSSLALLAIGGLGLLRRRRSR